MSGFTPCGLISLSSDFGLRDPFVGLMKAVILSRFPAARLIDLCHDLPVFKPDTAGFWLAHCWRYFPDGTVHLSVVDPGVGGSRAMRLVQLATQVFVAPDNGLLDEVEQSEGWVCSRQFALGDLAELRLGSVSHTFHGRDVFAPVVAALAAGSLSLTTLGRVAARRKVQRNGVLNNLNPLPAGAIGQVKVIDHFGNLITDVELPEELDTSANKYRIGNQLIDFNKTYSTAKPGDLLALRNSFGLLEIARAEGNAAQFFAAQIGMPVFLAEP